MVTLNKFTEVGQTQKKYQQYRVAAYSRYLIFVGIANLLWEILHVPLFTIWNDGTASEIGYDILWCTGGDVLIASFSVLLAIIISRNISWPISRFARLALLTLAFGMLCTIFLEWFNIVVLENWSYSNLMPVVPVIGIGLSPFLQWLVIPILGLWWFVRDQFE